MVKKFPFTRNLEELSALSLKHLVCSQYVHVVLTPHFPGFLPQYPRLESQVLALISCCLAASHWFLLVLPCVLFLASPATAPHPAGISSAGPDFLSPVSAPVAGTISTLRVSRPCYFLRWSIYQLACVAEPVYPFPTTPSPLDLAPSCQPTCLG